MRDGCAGFFTAEELAAGKGIVPRSLDLPRKTPSATADRHVSHSDVSHATRRAQGRRAEARRFRDGVRPAVRPRRSARSVAAARWPDEPGARVAALDPTGGAWGLGLIRAEADIHPGDWFMVCHFVDDRVMPGTLMYECCLHALRIFMMSRAGSARADG